jgi:hypothetical protein
MLSDRQIGTGKSASVYKSSPPGLKPAIRKGETELPEKSHFRQVRPPRLIEVGQNPLFEKFDDGVWVRAKDYFRLADKPGDK